LVSSSAYPPFDDNVRNYLTCEMKEELAALTRHFAFLEALFLAAVQALESYQKGSSEDIARRWYDWMSYGATPTTVGTNRTEFYGRVIEHAAEVRRLTVFLMSLKCASWRK
jgi:hypothetical protein